TLLTVLAAEENAEACEQTLFLETTTFGVRRARWFREVLQRETAKIHTPYGLIRIKVAYQKGKRLKAAPEYEDVARAARFHGVSFHEVSRAALVRLDQPPVQA